MLFFSLQDFIMAVEQMQNIISEILIQRFHAVQWIYYSFGQNQLKQLKNKNEKWTRL